MKLTHFLVIIILETITEKEIIIKVQNKVINIKKKYQKHKVMSPARVVKSHGRKTSKASTPPMKRQFRIQMSPCGGGYTK